MTRRKNSMLSKIWYFIWKDESIWSWIVDILLAFVLIKFLIYPALGYGLATSHPVVAVMSESMEHDGNFDSWWSSQTALCDKERCSQEAFYSEQGISKEQFTKFRFKNGLYKADMVLVYGDKDIKVGDVVVYWSTEPIPIIHRVIKKWEENGKYYIKTKGDHNMGVNYNEAQLSEEQIVGKAVLKIPLLGWLKIGFVKLLNLFGIPAA